ncbi:Mg/Co/Ni transporter MgtE / CBS domain [hydrothermal vent metagenome]|uniref:Mg/Co/Ni transporter MgtE / CBS domain n=1 Tax=hydrothermal vent metagenome TaxID=652676 RepID=A0A1W1BC03_9ZZZZ
MSLNRFYEYINSHDESEMHPGEIAELLRGLSDEEFDEAVKKIPKSLLGDVALILPDRYFDDVVENLSVEELKEVVEELESDDKVEFLEELEEIDQEVAKQVFSKLDKEDKEEIKTLKQYEEDEAGAYMQTEVFTAREDEIVEEVIKRFAKLKKANELENVQNLFITDEENKLKYAISLADLLTFDFKKSIKENILESQENFEPIKAYDKEDIKDVVHYFEQYDLSVIPVVDSEGHLLGRITSDDIYDIINEHATEQMYNLAGVDDDAEEDDDIIIAGKKRATWLGINLLTAIFASLVIGLFQDTINSMVALAVLMPIVASMGGNAGTQTLTVVVRQLALGEIATDDAIRIIKKEVIISLMNGGIFAVVMGVIAWLWFHMPLLGVVIGLSMIINLLMAGFFGAVIPLILKKLHIDPAVGSAVVLTTITDVMGFFSFLGLAKMMLL